MTTTFPTKPESTCRVTLSRPTMADRLLSLAVLAVTSSVLGAAAWLEADPAGLGTHQKLGLPACGFNLVSGLPCATCGMTTAFTHAAHGNLWQAFVIQPAGAVLAVLTAAGCLISLYSLMAGISLRPIFAWAWRVQTVMVLAGIVLAAWIYKAMIVQGWLGT